MPERSHEVNRQIVLARRPVGVPSHEDFSMVEGAVPEPAEGQVLIRHAWLGLAPAARLRMSEEASYSKPLALGEVVYGQAVGTVVASRHPGFVPGDTAVSMNGGWQQFSLGSGAALSKVDLSIAPASAWLGVLGTSGMTAYVGLLDIGTPASSETVLVSAASGAVGSAVGQLAKLKGCRAVGIAGGEVKCRLAVEQYGFDACADYRSPDFARQLALACPRGVDVLFENVGGASRDAAWPLLNQRARVVVCGLISEYNGAHLPGPAWFPILVKRLSVRGFILSDHLERRPAFLRDMAAWYSQGKVTMKEDVRNGLEQVVPSFIAMLEGRNVGKTVVQL
jgi:NADPH-dependent curcumin reductase CurA